MVGGWVGGGLMEIDAEFKFAKIQNSYVQWGGEFVETNFQLLMLSSNLLKSKIPMAGGGGGVGGTNFQLLMLSPNLLKKKKKKIAKNFLSFQAKSITVLFWTLSTKWFPYGEPQWVTKPFVSISDTEWISVSSVWPSRKTVCVE